MKKELLIFIAVFFILAISFHFDQWIDHPIIHLSNIASGGGAFGVPGIIHPFVFAFVAYVLLSIPRGIAKLFKKK
jgi:hypothetical protein